MLIGFGQTGLPALPNVSKPEIPGYVTSENCAAMSAAAMAQAVDVGNSKLWTTRLLPALFAGAVVGALAMHLKMK